MNVTQSTRHSSLLDELAMLVISNDGKYQLESNKLTHRHCLFIELQNGEFSRNFVFANRHDILRLMGSSDFQYLIAQFDDAEYLINIQPRNDDEQ